MRAQGGDVEGTCDEIEITICSVWATARNCSHCQVFDSVIDGCGLNANDLVRSNPLYTLASTSQPLDSQSPRVRYQSSAMLCYL
jgi:hypothetical protein